VLPDLKVTLELRVLADILALTEPQALQARLEILDQQGRQVFRVCRVFKVSKEQQARLVLLEIPGRLELVFLEQRGLLVLLEHCQRMLLFPTQLE
jgi:hypothetical protein